MRGLGEVGEGRLALHDDLKLGVEGTDEMASVFGIVGSGTDVLNLNVNGIEIEYALLFLDFRDVATR